jgi:hypothetical protein
MIKLILKKPNIGLFDQYIDMCYILTMENSSRTIQFIDQINTFKIASNIIIQINKGYKKCNKKLYKQASNYDLNDCYYNVFKHANKNNYKNILILEDDFMFDKYILTEKGKKTIDSIGKFITTNTYHLYTIGPTIHISYPVSIEHHKSLLLHTSHSVIYSHLYIKHFIENYENNKVTKSFDEYWNKFEIKKYKYYKAICYQIFYKTENTETWPFKNFALFMSKLLKLDHKPQPGFSIANILFYIVSGIIFSLLLLIIVLLIVLIIRSKASLL